jgi:hypothetical protein
VLQYQTEEKRNLGWPFELGSIDIYRLTKGVLNELREIMALLAYSNLVSEKVIKSIYGAKNEELLVT